MKITLQYFEEEMVVRQYYQWVATSAEPSCQTLYSSIINWISEENLFNSNNIYIPLCVWPSMAKWEINHLYYYWKRMLNEYFDRRIEKSSNRKKILQSFILLAAYFSGKYYVKALFLQYCVRFSLETCLASQLSGRGSDLRNPLDLSSVSVTIHPDKLSLKRNTFSSTSKKCFPILRGERKEILI